MSNNTIIGNPLLSVIMPVYNSEKYLPDALDSIVNQTYKNIEIIIVNNGSSGNVDELFANYQKEYPYFKWVFINLKENVGWYNAIINGLQEMHGDFFTEMDSDDTISIDYYYQMLSTAIMKKADVVSAEFAHKIGSNDMVHCPLNDSEWSDFEWHGKDILTKYIEYRGRNYNCGTMWSKIYSKSIWTLSKQYLLDIDDYITNCADVMISCILLGQAKKWVNVHNVYYYHSISNDSGTVRVSKSVKEMKFGFECTYNCFKNMKSYLVKISRYDELRESFLLFQDKYIALMFVPLLQNNTFAKAEKEKLIQFACNLFSIKEPIAINSNDILFENRVSPFDNGLEDFKKAIIDPTIEYISFDIFDTLVERPFLHPDDVFDLLSIEYNKIIGSEKYIDFAAYRRSAQRICYEKMRNSNPFCFEITLDEIYEEIVEEKLLSTSQAEYLKKKEIELEYRFCRVRMIGKQLYEFAIRAGKKIICISDMYLSKEVISTILSNNGYNEIHNIFLSSEQKVCKSDGKLFKRALSILNIRSKSLLHIGDNIDSDFNIPHSLGIAALHISAARDLLMGKAYYRYCGQSFPNVIGEDYNPLGGTGYIGNRCILGIVANKVFGNPFLRFNLESDYDCNPNIIGYYLLGTYVFSVAKWLMKITKEKGYSTIHFIARDGLLFKKAYDILTSSASEKYAKSNYLHTSRKSLFPLMINRKTDIYSIKNFYDIDAMTPSSFIEMMKPIIPNDVYLKKNDILKEKHIELDIPFDSEEQWIIFADTYIKCFYSEECIKTYRNQFKLAFNEIIGENACSFDVGYSLRSEMLLSEVLGKKVDACYLFFQRERALNQSLKSGIEVNAFHSEPLSYDSIPALEQIISSIEDGCYGYRFSNGQIDYLYQKNDKSVESAFIIDTLQKRAIEFVNDMITTFPEWESLPYRFNEKPFMSYIHHAKLFDKGLLDGISLSDPLCRLDEDTSITSLWRTTPYGTNNIFIPYPEKTGVKGALVNYFKKKTPKALRPFAKMIKRLLKW